MSRKASENVKKFDTHLRGAVHRPLLRALDKDDGRPSAGAVRPEAQAPGRGHRLRRGAAAGLDGQGQGHCAARTVWDRNERTDGTLSSSQFEWDDKTNEYKCPQGHALRSQWRAFKVPRSGITKADTIICKASQHACTGCPLKRQCCPDTPSRRVARSVHESSRDVARALAATPEYRQSRRERKKVEMLFAHLKRILRLDRLGLRGLTGANDEFLLAATAQTLRRMAKRLIGAGGEPTTSAS